jgi:D-alanyl-D-alanine carboxypeptidase
LRRPASRLAAGLAVGGLLLAGCGQSTEGSGAASPPPASISASPLAADEMSAADAREVDELAEAVVAEAGEDEMPSLLLGVWDPDKGSYRSARGDGDRDGEVDADVDDAFRIGSITKTFVATLVLRLVADGRLELDEPISTFAPDLAGEYPEIGERTVRQLLAMRSGLPDFEAELTGGMAANPEWTQKAWTAEELIDAAMDSGEVTQADAEPASYCNTNYVVLGEVLSEVTGTPVGDLVTGELITPLGLSRTRYPQADDTSLVAPNTRGYVPASQVPSLTVEGGSLEPGTDVTDWTASWGGAAGIMDSTLDDLALWAATDFGSSLLPDDLVEQRNETLVLDELSEYGLGLQKVGQWRGHLGGIPGWSTLAMRNAETGAVVVMATNAEVEETSLAHLLLLDTLYPGTLQS